MTKQSETRVPALSVETDAERMTVTVTFADTSTLVVQVGDLSADIIAQATLHGLKQKLVDAAAISRDPETGRSASLADKANAVREVAERLASGEWNKRRADGEGGAGGLLLRALIRMKPERTRAQLEEFLTGKSKAEQAALRANPKVAAVIETIRAESAKGTVDTDSMLDGI